MHPTPIHSLPFSTSSLFCSSFSCSFALVHTSALSHRGSFIATSKGASPRFWASIVHTSSPPFFAFHDPTPSWVRPSSCQILTSLWSSFLGIFFMSARIGTLRLQRLFRDLIPPLPSVEWGFRSVCIQERGYHHTSRWRALQRPCR